jgi:hypothetical protein
MFKFYMGYVSYVNVYAFKFYIEGQALCKFCKDIYSYMVTCRDNLFNLSCHFHWSNILCFDGGDIQLRNCLDVAWFHYVCS